MPGRARDTSRAAAEAASLADARAAVRKAPGAAGRGSTDPLVGNLRRARLAGELEPRMERIERSIRAIRAEVLA